MSARKRWIGFSARAKGKLQLDAGAARALTELGKSLLPSGIVSVEGDFKAGDIVLLNDAAKAMTSIDAAQLRSLAGKHSTEIKKALGPDHRDVVAIPEDIVFIDY
mgnify:CR=1 FL=1